MNIAICGLGKAGSALAKKIILLEEHNIICGLCREESLTAGKDVGEILCMRPMNIPIIKISQLYEFVKNKKIDVIIDFSNKNTSLRLIDESIKYKINTVICTTNFSPEEYDFLKRKIEKGQIGVVYAPTLTIGINMVIEFVKRISRLTNDFDFAIVERHRKDKPIGTTTAKIIAQNICRANVPIHSVRAGGYVGVHEITAASESERITIEHESFNREAFAKGALLAACFIEKRTGYFEMKDVIDEWEKREHNGKSYGET